MAAHRDVPAVTCSLSLRRRPAAPRRTRGLPRTRRRYPSPARQRRDAGAGTARRASPRLVPAYDRYMPARFGGRVRNLRAPSSARTLAPLSSTNVSRSACVARSQSANRPSDPAQHVGCSGCGEMSGRIRPAQSQHPVSRTARVSSQRIQTSRGPRPGGARLAGPPDTAVEGAHAPSACSTPRCSSVSTRTSAKSRTWRTGPAPQPPALREHTRAPHTAARGPTPRQRDVLPPPGPPGRPVGSPLPPAAAIAKIRFTVAIGNLPEALNARPVEGG